MDIVAGQQLHARYLVAGDQALNLVENSERIEGAQPRFKVLRGQPDAMTVRLAGLRTPGLPHVRVDSATEGNQLLGVRTHAIGEPYYQFKIGANAGPVSRLLHQLLVAKGVGDGS